jgi:hypothetical protein
MKTKLSAAHVSKKTGTPLKKIRVVTGYEVKTWPHDHQQGKDACLWCRIHKTVLREHGRIGSRFLNNLVARNKRNFREASILRSIVTKVVTNEG